MVKVGIVCGVDGRRLTPNGCLELSPFPNESVKKESMPVLLFSFGPISYQSRVKVLRIGDGCATQRCVVRISSSASVSSSRD